MYRVLLVDDEKIIREGVFELLSMTALDLELTMAASAMEAIHVMEESKIDIAIMDVRMPQMSGLELYDIIRDRWPLCKLIFLTGHLEFDYVYKVHKHARYILKAEEDEKLVEAVKESIGEIENDLLLEQATLDRSMHQHLNKYYERMLLLKELVEGSASSSSVSQEMLDHMWAGIDITKPVYAVMVRCSALRRAEYTTQPQLGQGMGLLMDKFFLEQWNGNFYGYNKHLTYLLLQPKTEIPESQALTVLEGCAEVFQKAVEKNLNLSVALYIGRNPVAFSRAINDFMSISDQMVAMMEDEIRIGSVLEEAANDSGELPEPVRRMLAQKLQQIGHQLDNMDRNGIFGFLNQIREQVKGVSGKNDLFVMELYYALVTKMLSYAQKVGFNEALSRHIGILDLNNIAQYKDWESAFCQVQRVVEHAFEHVDISVETKNEDVVNKVKSYISAHLDGDTSLHILSDHVALCPEHLLRVFKKQEGVTILQYINDLKLTQAKQLLSETELPIKKIASQLGFTSAGYFGRFFKSKLGITPNVYREQIHK